MALVIVPWSLLSGLILTSAAPWPKKLCGEIVLTLLYRALWPGWGLYTTRACKAVDRSGVIVAREAESVRPKDITITRI